MKKFLPLFVLVLFLASCASSTKLYQRGRYDQAINKSVKKILRKPGNTKEMLVLDKAYKIANERDWERINYLKLENNPADIEEIVTLFNRLKYRQSTVRKVLPLQLPDRMINYPYIHYDEEIVKARASAADYFYHNAVRLMGHGNKDAYRQAYKEFVKVKAYGGRQSDLDQMIYQSRQLGTNRVLVMVQNHTHLNLGREFENQLLAIKPSAYDSEWVEYHFRDLDEGIDYDFYIVANIRIIDVSPDMIKDSDRMVNKKVEDGFEYLLDPNGNVVKDSIGNDVKIPRFKNISCAVIETLQQKHSAIEGDVEFIQLNPQRLLRKEPAGAANAFEHRSARAIGDLQALDEETLRFVKVKPVPFPSDMEMVYRSAESMREAITRAMQKNKNLIR